MKVSAQGIEGAAVNSQRTSAGGPRGETDTQVRYHVDVKERSLPRSKAFSAVMSERSEQAHAHSITGEDLEFSTLSERCCDADIPSVRTPTKRLEDCKERTSESHFQKQLIITLRL